MTRIEPFENGARAAVKLAGSEPARLRVFHCSTPARTNRLISHLAQPAPAGPVRAHAACMANASAAEVWLGATDEQTVALSRCGELIAARNADTIDIFDARGRAGTIAAAPDFAWIGARLWVAAGDHLRALAPDGTCCAELALDGARPLIPAGAAGALAGNHLVLFEDGELVARDLGDGEPAVGFLGGLRALRANGRRLRVTDPGRELYRLQLPGDGVISRAVEVLGGAAIAVETETPEGRAIDLLKLPGTLIRHIELPGARAVAFAASAGLALVTTRADQLVAVDLRYGHVADPMGSRPTRPSSRVRASSSTRTWPA